MPTTHQINLLQKDTFEESTTGKLLKWATTMGRWIVVFTNLVVILAFFSRFYFDTKLANLYDEIKQSQAIIEATSDFEESFRLLQKRLDLIKTLISPKFESENRARYITSLLPHDVSLSNFSISKNEVNLSGVALSKFGISTLLNSLLSSPQISKINISQLEFGDKEVAGAISFALSATWKNQ